MSSGEKPIPQSRIIDANVVIFLQEADAHFLAFAVDAGVCQGFLNDSVDGIFQNRGQPVENNSTLELDFRSFLAAFFVNEVGNGLDDP